SMLPMIRLLTAVTSAIPGPLLASSTRPGDYRSGRLNAPRRRAHHPPYGFFRRMQQPSSDTCPKGRGITCEGTPFVSGVFPAHSRTSSHVELAGRSLCPVDSSLNYIITKI